MTDYVRSMFEAAAAGELQGVWFWAAVYCALVCAYSLRKQLQTRSWPSTTGRLERLGARKFGAAELVRSEQDYVGDALYTYEVDGTAHDGTRISPWVMAVSYNARPLLAWQQRGVERDEDGSVRVYYDPARPEKSFLVVAGWPGIVLTAAVMLTPAASYVLRFHG